MKNPNYNPHEGQAAFDTEVRPKGMDRREILKKLGATVAVAGLGGFGAGIGAAEIRNRQRAVAYDEYHVPIEGDHPPVDYTEIPPDEVRALVDTICNDPTNDSVVWREDVAKERQLMQDSGLSYSEYHAEKAGLHLLESKESFFAMEHAQSIDELMEGFDVLTRQFGAEITLADNWEYLRITPDLRERYYGNRSDLDILRHRFMGMAHSMKHVPKELFELSGVKNIHFTEFTTTPIKTASGDAIKAGGSAWMDGSGKIDLSLDSIYAGRVGEFTLYHEVGHLLDEVLSKGFQSAVMDKGFNALNAPGFEYYGVLHDELEVDGFIRPYSAYNVLEDKAIVFENVLSGIDYHLSRSPDPILREKCRLQLARLEWHIPNITPYLSLHGYHGAISPRNPYSPLWGKGVARSGSIAIAT